MLSYVWIPRFHEDFWSTEKEPLRFGLPYLACGQQEHSVPFLFIGIGSSMRLFRKLFSDGNQGFGMVLRLLFTFEVDFDVPVYFT